MRGVRLRKDMVVVALEQRVLAYAFADLRLLLQMETLDNPAGLVALSCDADSTVLACPGLQPGQVRWAPRRAVHAPRHAVRSWPALRGGVVEMPA